MSVFFQQFFVVLINIDILGTNEFVFNLTDITKLQWSMYYIKIEITFAIS